MKKTVQARFRNAMSGKDHARRNVLGSEQGSSLIELAFLMPVFLLLIMGATEFGWLAYDSVAVSNAAYAGAAYGAQSRTTAMDITNMEAAAIEDGANVAGMTATATTSCTCSSGTAITCANSVTTCSSPDRIFELVQVNTSATVTPILHVANLPVAFTLHGQAILRVQR